ncbi:MAG: carbohydrate porin [Bdellovibrionia bacterium]
MIRKRGSQIYVSASLLALAMGSASLGFAEEAKTAEDAISSVREKLKKLEANQQATPSQVSVQPEVKITVVPSPVPPSAAPAAVETAEPESESEEQAPPPKKKKEKKKKRKIKEKSKSKLQAKKEAESLEKLAGETPLPQRSATRETQEVPPVAESPMEEESRLTKNWGGARKKISDLGIDLALIYRGEWNRNFSGGIRQASTYLSNIDLRVSVDGEKLVGWKGGSFFFYGLGDLGGDPSKNVGDAQISSNIETPVNTAKVYELWAQQILFEDKVSVLVGMHDLNSEFYVTDSSGLFFNSTFGVGKDLSQTGVNGPSIFPTTAPAIRFRVEPTKEFYFQFGVWNAQSGDPGNPYGTKFRLNAKDGLLLISEMAYLRGKIDQTKNPGKYGIGYWTYTRTFDSLHNSITDSSGNTIPTQASSHGIYFLAEQSIFGNVTLFCRYGIASTEVNRFGTSLGTGVVFTGLVPHRPKDRFGVALARVTNGGEYEASLQDQGVVVPGAESAIEANYRIELLPGIAVQPDYQYIIHPQGDPVANPGLANASVGSIRFELSF